MERRLVALMLVFACIAVFGGVRPNPDKTFTLTVVNGTGGGDYPVATPVTVAAVADGANGVFSHWTAEGMTLTEAQSKENPLSIVMPETNVTLTAHWETVSQTLPLVAGWNWVGFNVLPSGRNVGDVIGKSGFTVNDTVQTNGGMSRFTGTSWIPGSFTIEYGCLYQIYVAKATTVTVTGGVSGLSSLPVTAGWNWIANPTAAAVTPADLAHSGGWTAGDRIQSPDGGVTYTGGKWVPAGFTLEPGKGCQIYTANEGTLSFSSNVVDDDALYAVVDLSGGPDAESYPVRYTNEATDLDDDTCRTTELWLRQIPASTFTMGSPEDEVGRDDDETQHQLTLTQDFYMGVFECTQKQWDLVMGSNPSDCKGDCRPVEYVSYDMIRGIGVQAGAGWPTYGHEVDASSFMGKLQAKTGLVFDLPTEAQWEYACRAGTMTALNSGKNLTSAFSDTVINEVGRYSYNQSAGKGGYTSEHTKVGSYHPNAWGLYDMHGNVYEWCLDWWSGGYSASTVTDPAGDDTGSTRMVRGGSWNSYARYCRSANRASYTSSFTYYYVGFRVVCLP